MAGQKLKIDLIQGEGKTLLAKGGSNHWVAMDTPISFGGSDAGTRPIELFLMGLAGCTSVDVINILEKKRVPFTDFKVTTTAERGEEHPKVFKSVNVHFKIYGKKSEIKIKAVERAIELSSETYCAASAMLKASMPVTTSYEIIEPK